MYSSASPNVVFLSHAGLAVSLTTSRMIGLLLLFADHNVFRLSVTGIFADNFVQKISHYNFCSVVGKHQFIR